MKIQLVDLTQYEINDIAVDNGTLKIDFKDKTAEEIETLLSNSGNLNKIEVLEEETSESLYYFSGFTVFEGVYIKGDVKRGMLSKQPDPLLSRLDQAEQNSIEATTTAGNANTTAEDAKKTAESAGQSADTNASDITNLQEALAEVYEMVATTASAGE